MYSWFIGVQSKVMLRYGVLLPSSKKQTNRLTLDDQPEMKACALQKGSMKLTRGQEACKKSQRTGIRSFPRPFE